MKLSQPHRVPGAPRCPHCAHQLDGASGIGHANAPKDGDVTCCISCAAMLRFFEEAGGVLVLRTCDPRTLDAETRATLEEAQTNIRTVHAARRAARGGKWARRNRS